MCFTYPTAISNREKSGCLVMNLYESFKEMKQFSGFKPSSLYLKSENISGISVIIAYTERSKETGFNCVVQRDADPLGKYGYSFEIVSLLQEILNFSVNYKVVAEVDSDPANPHNSDADMVICHPSLDSIPDNVQLLLPTLHSRLVIVYKTSGLPLEKDLFLRNTAGGHMWLYLFGVSILLALCFRLSTHLHHRLQPRHNDWSWLEVVQWTFGAACQQGSAKQPQGCSCRTMFLIGYIITNMIYTGFAAGITSLLAIRSKPTELRWQQAVRMDIPYVVVCNSGAERYMKNLVVDGRVERKFKCVTTLEELVRQVEHSSTAGVLSEASLTYHYRGGSGDVQCHLAVAKQLHHNHFSGFVVKRKSPLIGPFNYWLLRFKEHGLLKRMLERYLSRLPDCQLPPGYTKVSFKHVKSPFLIISGNIIISVIILCIEILLQKYNVLLKQRAVKTKNGQRFVSMYNKRSVRFRKIDLNNEQ